MEDRDIVTLYWQRDQEAIRQTDRQYGRYLSSIAFHILADREDSRETVNDTYLRAWDSMPPHRPQVLATYLGRITRQLSIDRWRARGRAKRGGSQYALSLEELGDCVSGAATPEEALDLAELGTVIPMHQWEDFAFTDEFLSAYPQFAPITVKIHRDGEFLGEL